MTDLKHAARGRPRACSEAERRSLLLTAAEEVFLTAGYHAATMDEFARRAGMSKKTIYQVFASKAELFRALLTDRFMPLTLPVEGNGLPIAEQLTAVLRHMASFCLEPRQLAMTRLMIAEAPQSREMADALEYLGIGKGNGVLERWVKAQIDLGTLPQLQMPDATNTLFFAAVGEALLHSLLRLGDRPTAAVLEQRIRYAVRTFLSDARASPDRDGGP